MRFAFKPCSIERYTSMPGTCYSGLSLSQCFFFLCSPVDLCHLFELLLHSAVCNFAKHFMLKRCIKQATHTHTRVWRDRCCVHLFMCDEQNSAEYVHVVERVADLVPLHKSSNMYNRYGRMVWIRWMNVFSHATTEYVLTSRLQHQTATTMICNFDQIVLPKAEISGDHRKFVFIL